jgi:hypothetical protein
MFFVPHRRGQGRSPGVYMQDPLALSPPHGRPERMIELQEIDNADVIAALAYLRSQPFVDPAQIAISGGGASHRADLSGATTCWRFSRRT